MSELDVDGLLEALHDGVKYTSKAEGDKVMDQALWLYWQGVPVMVRVERVDELPSE